MKLDPKEISEVLFSRLGMVGLLPGVPAILQYFQIELLGSIGVRPDIATWAEILGLLGSWLVAVLTTALLPRDAIWERGLWDQVSRGRRWSLWGALLTFLAFVFLLFTFGPVPFVAKAFLLALPFAFACGLFARGAVLAAIEVQASKRQKCTNNHVIWSLEPKFCSKCGAPFVRSARP